MIVERLALLHGRGRIVSIGPSSYGPEVAVDRRLRLVAASPGSMTGRHRARFPYDDAWTWDRDHFSRPSLPSVVLADSVLVCSATLEGMRDPAPILGMIRAWLDEAAAAVITLELPPERAHASEIERAAHLERFRAMLAAERLDPTFLGWTASTSAGRAKTTAMAIVDRVVGPGPSHAPADFRVTAIMTAYNEADVIGPAIEALISDGVLVHVIDNWSTDETPAIAETYLGRGVVAVERYPEAPTQTYDWTRLLARVEEVAQSTPTDWVIHHDADERRTPPWMQTSLRDGLWTADRSGFTAVDHTVMNFRPIDNGYVAGASFEDHFRWFELGSTPDLLLQVKAWKRTAGLPVDLRTSGGHDAAFEGRRVFPYKFLLKHYPIRSQGHGERKVRVDRVARWNPEERAMGWHDHYDSVGQGHSFLSDPATLSRFDPETAYATWLGEIVAGASLVPDPAPAWARGSLLTRRLHEVAMRVVIDSGLSALISRGTARTPRSVRTRLVRAKRTWLG